MLTTFGQTRRQQRRRALRSLVLGVLALAVIAAGALAVYRIGLAQGRTEAVRLSKDVQRLQAEARSAAVRAAAADQQAAQARARVAELEARYAKDVPSGAFGTLVDLLKSRLAAGIPPQRLEFVLREAREAPRCDARSETQTLPVHTATSTEPLTSVGFAGKKLSVTAEGADRLPPAEDGTSLFDIARPVRLRFLRIDGDVSTAEGVLPFTHAMMLDDQELQIAVTASPKPDAVEVTVRGCSRR